MSKFVAILIGSESDIPIMQGTFNVLSSLGVIYEWRIASAHRTPEYVHSYVKNAIERGAGVFITAAGLANHLSGTVAALTLKPVIGVPIASGPLQGQDALLSTVQMPPGIPVACVGINGAKNAAYLAAQILAVSDVDLEGHLDHVRAKAAVDIITKNNPEPSGSTEKP